MKLVRGIFSVVAALLCCTGIGFAAGQGKESSALRFDHTEFDFGTIREQDGKVSHTFTFINTGREPVVIVSASSSCGCTVPTFTRKPVMPSERGSIEVTYDPANRPGTFSKSIAVTTSEQCPALRLTVSGNTESRPRTVEEIYAIYAGDGLRIEDNFHSFSFVEHGKTSRTTIGIINTSGRTLQLNVAPASADSPLKVAAPATLKPRERGEIVIACTPAAGRYGTFTDLLRLTINGRRSDAAVTVTGIIIDNRDVAEDNFAPQAEINKNIVKFGVVKHREAVCTEYIELSNRGDAPLHIRAVDSGDEAAGLSVKAGDTIGAGESRRTAVSIRPRDMEYGPAVGRIRIITDDPARPLREIKYTVVVED